MKKILSLTLLSLVFLVGTVSFAAPNPETTNPNDPSTAQEPKTQSAVVGPGGAPGSTEIVSPSGNTATACNCTVTSVPLTQDKQITPESAGLPPSKTTTGKQTQ